jgi:hypothetical protein
MGRIYSTAQITLIASAGETSAYGLPGVRPGSREHTFHYEAVGCNYLIAMPSHCTKDVFKSKWATRAWWARFTPLHSLQVN